MAYLPLSTANLPDPVINPAQGASPADHFNTVLWTADGTNGNISISDVGFQPDFVWAKRRSTAYNNIVFDSVRGTGDNGLITDGTYDEATVNADLYGYISSFDSSGFTATAGTSSNGYFNNGTDTYVAWNWKANGSGVTNTDGSITSTVSANTTSGFSIGTFVGSTSVFTVGHGLSQAPELVIQKGRDTATAWWVYHKDIGATGAVRLDGTGATVTASSLWNNTAPTSSVVTFGAGAASANNWLMYCFHSVEGFSKFGSYVGNGSTDGTFVYTGFRPAFILIKSSTVSGSAWYLFDEERNIYNPLTYDLYANYSNAESGSSSGRLDMLSNGFKMRSTSADTNSNGATMIYMAFAENPFKYSNAR